MTHPAYQQIIGMGPLALPFIIDRLRTRGGHWYWALMCITGEDPVEPGHSGKVPIMQRAWFAWADDRAISRGHAARMRTAGQGVAAVPGRGLPKKV